MPVILDDLDLSNVTSTTAKAVSPQFFSSKLTGSGKKVGLLNQNLLPVNTTTNANYKPHEHIESKTRSTHADITTSMIPFAPLTRRALSGSQSYRLPVAHPDDRFACDLAPLVTGAQAASAVASRWNVYFDMTPQACVLYEDGTGEKIKRDLVIQYRMELGFVPKNTPTELETLPTDNCLGPITRPMMFVSWSTSPLTEATDFINGVLGASGRLSRLDNTDELDAWMRDYDIHERITRQAQIWDGGDIADVICSYIRDVAQVSNPGTQQLNQLADLLRYLENYNVPLDAYRAIHQAIEKTFPDDVATELAKQNLNLLMNHTLDHLDRMKPQLAVPAQPAGPVNLPARLSIQQRNALTTHEPLVMTQAGAGTGKSSVILERIAYLQQCGVHAQDVTVLSFTNAAADNITAKNPDVGSMTIARMIHDIYSLNHPSHELSSIDTIVNSLDIFYPADDFAARFRSHLVKVDKNETHAFTAMNTFIERNYDQVLAILDRIKQTSLELEIIICYQCIDAMLEPAHVQCRHLIIDEVQDNSVFEFIYLLKYVSKHALSLFIVGDASQTLYEFRSANPRALNTLESSGVFTTFKLTTNYRSNQEILDFANVVLGQLETNQFANIQLQANSLAVPTAASFQEKVQVNYRLSKQREFLEHLPSLMRVTVIPDYVDACLDRGEQVAFLAHRRLEVNAMQAALEARYPNRQVASLVSEKVYATDIFSGYIKHFWNEVLQVPPTQASFVVHQGIIDNLSKLTRNSGKAEMAVRRMVSNWWLENAAAVNAWVNLWRTGGLPDAQFYEQLRDNLLSFEIRHNAVRQALLNQKNRERKALNAAAKSELVVSTIHGAKGMEFDNVVIVHKEDTRMSEDNRRMYYVAFTRAIKSEYVLSYGSVVNAPIETNHKTLVTLLEQRDKRAAAIAAGVDPDLVDDDESANDDGSSTNADQPVAV